MSAKALKKSGGLFKGDPTPSATTAETTKCVIQGLNEHQLRGLNDEFLPSARYDTT
jgi:hypothetical protein